MVVRDENGATGETNREVGFAAQLIAGIVLMMAFAGVIWLVLGVH